MGPIPTEVHEANAAESNGSAQLPESKELLLRVMEAILEADLKSSSRPRRGRRPSEGRKDHIERTHRIAELHLRQEWSWGKIAKHVDPDGYKKNPQAARDRVRATFTYLVRRTQEVHWVARKKRGAVHVFTNGEHHVFFPRTAPRS